MVNRTVRRSVLLLAAILLVTPASALAQGAGGGNGNGGGGGGGGDVPDIGELYGDLVEVLRDGVTGVPILQARWIEDTGLEAVDPAEPPAEPGEGEEGEEEVVAVRLGYCPIALDAAGNEIGFAPISCEAADPTRVVPVDYFGRLASSRTQERNLRMHFDEVISKIKESSGVSQDATGRLALYECLIVDGVEQCAWNVVDSPLENFALYHRILKYGHIQTDPLEVDSFNHGDPTLGTVYHPALTPEDYAKLDAGTQALLPVTATTYTAEPLTAGDFALAAPFVATAADKTGYFTVDLVQYVNRGLRVTTDTADSDATLPTLPPMIRDCGVAEADALDQDLLFPDKSDCPIAPAIAGLPWPASERFVDFGVAAYDRLGSFGPTTALVSVIRPVKAGEPGYGDAYGRVFYVEDNAVPLFYYLASHVENAPSGTDIAGMVAAANDAVRAIQFVHNYPIPVALWDFVY